MAVVGIIWLLWVIVWIAMARGAKPVAKSEGVASRLTYLLPLGLAYYLLVAAYVPVPLLNDRFAPSTPLLTWLGAALTCVGTSFAIWARVRLAGNWSGTVTLKQNHELIVEGPYRWVRHPIYSGLLTAIIGTALARGEWRGLIAVAVATIALWRKLRLEEMIMRGEFGDTYARYAERVPALVPWLM
jgi:protein-S-isoprenylcysteine O-methyltransferase Ste14